MKKILMLLMSLSVISLAGDFEDGLSAYDNKNYTKAAKLFQKAADQGDASAQYNLGFMYYDGQGVKQDYAKAAKLWQKAADQGFAKAQYNLAFMYEMGKGVRQNKSKAKELYRKVCDGGVNEGCEGYADLNKKGF